MTEFVQTFGSWPRILCLCRYQRKHRRTQEVRKKSSWSRSIDLSRVFHEFPPTESMQNLPSINTESNSRDSRLSRKRVDETSFRLRVVIFDANARDVFSKSVKIDRDYVHEASIDRFSGFRLFRFHKIQARERNVPFHESG